MMKLDLVHTHGDACREKKSSPLCSQGRKGSALAVIGAENLKVHLDFLGNELLPKLLVTYGVGFYRPFRLWCLECPHPALPLEFVRALKLFQSGMPNFTFKVLVSDGCPERTAAARELFRQCYPDPSLESCLDFQQMEPSRMDLCMRMPQDLIVCYENLDARNGAAREQIVRSFSRLLFPGRILMGPWIEETLKQEPLFQKVEAGIYRRLSES